MKWSHEEPARADHGYAEAKPEATPIQAEDLVHFGDRAAVSRVLSRLTRSERLMRIYHGIYMRPIQTRFGLRAPSLDKALISLSELWGEVIVSNGGDAANWLGLTTQNAIRSVYLTFGPNRLLHFGKPSAPSDGLVRERLRRASMPCFPRYPKRI